MQNVLQMLGEDIERLDSRGHLAYLAELVVLMAKL